MAEKVSKRKAVARETSAPKQGKGAGGKEKSVAKGTIGGAGADLELVQRFKNGDPGAFDAIFEAYYSPLLGFLTRMCGSAADAEEGVQDTFLSVFRYLEGFRGEASLKNWIFKIAVTACLKKKRKMQAMPSAEVEGSDHLRLAVPVREAHAAVDRAPSEELVDLEGAGGGGNPSTAVVDGLRLVLSPTCPGTAEQ